MKRVGKRLLALLTVAAILCSFMVTGAAAADNPQVVVASVTGAVGNTVEVTVSVANNPGISAFKLPIVYNHDALELVNARDPEEETDEEIEEDRTDFLSGLFTLNNDTAVWVNTSNTKKNQVAVRLEFKIKDGAHSGEYTIGIGTAEQSNDENSTDMTNAVITNKDEQYVVFELGSGTVTVTGGAAHTYEEVVTKEATCQETGTKTLTCSCGDTKTETIEKTDHVTELKNAKEATCAEDGYTGDAVCTVCGQTITAGETIAKGTHVWNDGAVTTEPTCTETGVKTYTCTVCGETKTETIEKIDHITELKNVKEATCAEDGYTGDAVCTMCEQTITAGETIAKGAHVWDDGAVTTEPTCTEKGVKTYTCTVCEETKTEDIDALGHDVPQGEDYVAPTCTEAGATSAGICSRCGENIDSTEIPALGHTWDDGVVTTAATTSSAGVKTYTCTRCGETKEEEIAKLPSTQTTVSRPTVTPSTDDKTDSTDKTETPDDTDQSDKTETLVFTDVPEDTWYTTAVDWAVENGVTQGTSDTTFSPLLTCTRAQVVTFLWRAAGSPEPTTTENPFTDVADNNDYYKAILWAAETGITEGTSETTFSPSDPCTRAQVVTFLWRANGKPDTDAAVETFTDVSEDQYYADAVDWAIAQNITDGIGDGLFAPAMACSRAQVVTFLYRNAQD
jgi:hypothetical protein